MRRFIQSAFILITLFTTNCAAQFNGEFKPTESLSNNISVKSTETLASPLSASTPTFIREIHYGVVRVPTLVDEMIGELKGLSIGEFFDRSLVFWLSRDPESITILGLSSELGTRNNELTNISEYYVLDTEKLENSILNILQTYNRSELTIEDQLNYDIYEWFWSDRVAGHEFRLFDYPVQSNTATSVPDRIVNLLVNYHPIKNADDIEDYISRVYEIDEKISQLINELELRESLGITPPRAVLFDPINRYQGYLQRLGTQNYRVDEIIIYTNLKQKIDQIKSIDDAQKKNFLARTTIAIEESFIPSFTKLIEYLRGLLERSGDDVGVWTFAADSGYYPYLIHHYTSLNLTPEQISAIGEINLQHELERLRITSQKVFLEDGSIITETGIDPTDLEETYNLIGRLPVSKNYQAFRENIINKANILLTDVFNNGSMIVPETKDTVPDPPTRLASDPSIVFLSDPWIFAYNDPSTYEPDVPFLALPTMIYTEEYPGLAYFQLNSIQGRDLPLFRSVLTFNGYLEGWMGYSVDLMNDLGAYSDPKEEMFQIQRNVLLSASMVVDSGIHYHGWTIGESSIYLEDLAGLKRGNMRSTVERIVVTPGQVLSYQIGQQKFIELREFAQNELGEYFSLNDYHAWLLSLGNIPLSVLEKQVQDYVVQQQKINQFNVVP